MLHDNQQIRLYALEAVGSIGGTRAAELLIQAFDNQFWVVRSKAHEALLDMEPKLFSLYCGNFVVTQSPFYIGRKRHLKKAPCMELELLYDSLLRQPIDNFLKF